MAKKVSAVLALAACLGGAIFAWHTVTALDAIVSVKPLPWADYVAKAIDVCVAQATALSQVAAVALGGFATLFLLKPNEAGLQGGRDSWPEYLMAAGACILLSTSFLSGNSYVNGLVDALASVDPQAAASSGRAIEIPDVFSDKYDLVRGIQAWYLFLGLVLAAFPFLSLRMGKRSEPGR